METENVITGIDKQNMSTLFQKEKLIRFAHCDPAGIGFYPRYIELVNEVVEDWFSQGLNVSFRDFKETHGLVFPIVNLKAEFIAPSFYGDKINFTLKLLRIGVSSVTIDISAFSESEMRFRCELVAVLADAVTIKSVPFNDEWRRRFSQFLIQ